MNSIYEIFASKALAAYWEDVNVNMKDAMIGTRFFPNSRIQGLDLSWIKGKNGLPVVLQPSAYDTKASLRDRIGVTEMQTELPFFREAMRIGEKERQELGNLLAKGVEFASATIARLYDDRVALIDGAEAQAERMRMQLLVDAKISVVAGSSTGRKAAYDYNYDDASNTWATNNKVTLTSTDTWTVANKATSTPIQDINDMIEKAAEKGVIISEIIMTSTTLKGLLASESIVKSINPLGATNMILTRNQLKAYVEDMTGITITTYDKHFIDENKAEKKFYPDGYVTLVPSGALGNTYYGTTPEEYDLMSGETNAETSIVGGGVAVTTIKEPHPVNVQTIVSAQMLPSFEQMDKVFVMKVA